MSAAGPPQGARPPGGSGAQAPLRGEHTSTLVTTPNIVAPDDFYEALIDLHRGLSEAQSALVNAKLVLLLANHIGDAQVLRAAMSAAREEVGSDPT
ncbi:MAG: DUF2783 domain-containing protein [Burkholderiales bacterium]|nr:DUF2783 domain-containing protein [Burkholderiales bacterium]